jgi:putative addiction module component (TIGR02574 family)
MSSTLKRLGIDGLGVPERLELIGEIWDSIVSDPSSVPVPDAHRAEIQCRLDEFARDGDRGRPADEVIGDIKRRL